jgi:serpin B
LHFPQQVENVHAGFNAIDQTLTNSSSNADVELKIANSLWGQVDFQFDPEFLDVLKQFYGTGIHTTDFRDGFKAISEINNWIRNATNWKIDNAISEPPDPNTGLILVNAIYLNAKWQDVFKDRGDRAFYPLTGGTKSVSTMEYVPNSLNNKEILFKYAKGNHYEIVGIPYLDGKTEMVIILPEKGQFNQVEANLSGVSVHEMLEQRETRHVNLMMPKFRLEPPVLSVKTALSKMGMVEPFSDKADFSGIYQGHPLKIGDITQKTYIRVDENGTEAAAVGVMKFELISGHLGVVEMIVDRPFIFFIRNMGTGTILFLGRITDLP